MILTQQEASELLNYLTVDEMPEKVISVFLPAVDAFLKNATGFDWGTLTDTYTMIDPLAKMAAGVLLVRWFDDPSLIGKADDAGIVGLIGQLRAKVGELT